MMTDAHGIARDQLRSFIEHIMEEEALLDTYMYALRMIQSEFFDRITCKTISTSAGDSDLTPAAAARGSEESAAFNSTMEAAE